LVLLVAEDSHSSGALHRASAGFTEYRALVALRRQLCFCELIHHTAAAYQFTYATRHAVGTRKMKSGRALIKRVSADD
jgi:hypothetical protein